MHYRVSEVNHGLLFYVVERYSVSGLSPFGSVYIGMVWNQFIKRSGH